MVGTMPGSWKTFAAVACLVGFGRAHGGTQDSASAQPPSVVAQSDRTTAATGRRPLSQRIAASNLPSHEPSTPDCSTGSHCDVPDATSADDGMPADGAAENAVVPADGDVDPREPGAVRLAAGADPTDEELAGQPPPVPMPTAGHAHTHAAAHNHAQSRAHNHSRGKHPAAARQVLLGRIRNALGMPPRPDRPLVSRIDQPPFPDAAPDGPPEAAPEEAATVEAAAVPPKPMPAADAIAAEAVAPEPEPASQPDATRDAEELATAETEPARLEFDVRESRALVGEGEQIVMRIAVRNVGGEAAERVTATLFFAEGIEPVQAIGRAAEVYPGEVRFGTVPDLEPGASIDLLVTAVATRPGSVAYRGELKSHAPAGRVTREGTLTVRSSPATNQ